MYGFLAPCRESNKIGMECGKEEEKSDSHKEYISMPFMHIKRASFVFRLSQAREGYDLFASYSFRDFNQVKDIVFLIIINQGEIAAEGTLISKLSVSDGDTFVHPLAAIGFGNGNRGFVRIS